MERGNVDLRTCKKGDKLITAHGTEMEYVDVAPKDHYYDHIVEYKDDTKGFGSRTHDGYVFRHDRRNDDEDIVEINPIKK